MADYLVTTQVTLRIPDQESAIGAEKALLVALERLEEEYGIRVTEMRGRKVRPLVEHES